MAQNRATVATVLRSALANKRVADQIVKSIAGWSTPAMIIATSTSTTTDFAVLVVGDLVIHIAAAASNASFETVTTKGTKPSAAVVGDLYMVMRQVQLESDRGPVVPLI